MHSMRLFAAIAFMTCLSAGADTLADNKQVVRQMTEAINARNLDALDSLVAADVQRHSAATPDVVITDLDAFKAFLQQDFQAVPDSVMEINRILAEGNLVAVHVTYRGTQKGAWGPFPPSNKPVELPFISILRLEDGKIAEIWVEWDNMHALRQLGHLPPPDQAP